MKKMLLLVVLAAAWLGVPYLTATCCGQSLTCAIPTCTSFLVSVEIDSVSSWSTSGPYLVDGDSVSPWSFTHVLNFAVMSTIDTTFGGFHLVVTATNVTLTASGRYYLGVLDVSAETAHGRMSQQARKLFTS